MGANAKTDTEKAKVGIFELLREVAGRLKEELFVLAFGFALLVAYVAISIGQFSIWVAFTFIGLYLIAVVGYLARKAKGVSSQLQEEAKEHIKWSVGYPSAFPNPLKIAEKRPQLALVHFDMDFRLKNCMKKSLLLSVYVKSSTQAVGFAWDAPRKVWMRRFGIIPYREEVDIALDNRETRCIDENQEEKIVFHGLYRPRRANDDFVRRQGIVITFRIFGRGGEFPSLTHIDTHDKKIYIPFKDVVKYKSET